MPTPAATLFQDDSYRGRTAAEKAFYKDCAEVHDLPPIFHYWSNKYLRPKLEAFGFSSPDEMFRKYLLKQARRRPQETLRFVSIGAGNCDLEIALASYLRDQGHHDFTIDCLDFSPTMLERGRASAAAKGLGENIRLLEADFNQWTPARDYDAALANQALHHVVNLEGLFGRIRGCLKPHGSFIISDVIGRNGHLRWPEALAIVNQFWRRLPPSYRFNPSLDRYEERYEDWDCSTEGFEGIRAQDILRLLLANFHFELFIGFGNVIDPFIDRVFGHHFDAANPWDRAFIDQVQERDERELAAGRITPTHMIAVLGNDPGTPTLFHEPLRPEFCLRSTPAAEPATHGQAQQDAYDWRSWPHSPQAELETACRHLREAEIRLQARNRALEERAVSARWLEKELEERTAWALGLAKELEERTAWALRLDQELAERAARALRLDEELEERTAWALRLDQELAERTAWALRLDEEMAERTAWALRLDEALAERTASTLRLETELAERTDSARRLETELAERTASARRLETELEERTAWALRLDKELAERNAWMQEFNRTLDRLPFARALWKLARKALS